MKHSSERRADARNIGFVIFFYGGSLTHTKFLIQILNFRLPRDNSF